MTPAIAARQFFVGKDPILAENGSFAPAPVRKTDSRTGNASRVQHGQGLEFVRGFLIVDPAGGERRYQIVQKRALAAEKDGIGDAFGRETVRLTEDRSEIRAARPLFKPRPMAHDLGGQILETVTGIVPGHRFQAMRLSTVGNLFDNFGPEQGGGAIIHFGELGADTGLKREPPQERGAEGVDGLDLKAAGRLNRPGKKPPRILKPFATDAPGQAKLHQLSGQFRV